MPGFGGALSMCPRIGFHGANLRRAGHSDLLATFGSEEWKHGAARGEAGGALAVLVAIVEPRPLSCAEGVLGFVWDNGHQALVGGVQGGVSGGKAHVRAGVHLCLGLWVLARVGCQRWRGEDGGGDNAPGERACEIV